MSMLALFRWQGDADALVAAYDREMEDPPAITLDQPARTLHIFARGENAAVVVDLWESEDDFRRMFDDPSSSETSGRRVGQASLKSRSTRYMPRCPEAQPAPAGALAPDDERHS